MTHGINRPYTACMLIGNVRVEHPFLLAPLAGLTDSPMRQICRRMGAAMVWTEMVSAEGTIRDSERTFDFLVFRENERPVVFQIFGARADSMAGAAARVCAMKPDLIDINVGCPAKKVVRSGSGAALMKEPELLRDIATGVVEAADRPVTAKIRSGWDEDSINAVEVAGLLVECGIAAVAVHPRTRAQGFSGRADWSVISNVKRAIPVPVIGSGDVRSPADALRMLEETSCDGVMIGRGAVGNPWIFRNTVELLRTGRPPEPPTLAQTLRTAIEQLDLMVEMKGERRGVTEMRKHIVAYLRGFHGASRLRSELVRIDAHSDVRERLESAIAEMAEE